MSKKRKGCLRKKKDSSSNLDDYVAELSATDDNPSEADTGCAKTDHPAPINNESEQLTLASSQTALGLEQLEQEIRDCLRRHSDFLRGKDEENQLRFNHKQCEETLESLTLKDRDLIGAHEQLELDHKEVQAKVSSLDQHFQETAAENKTLWLDIGRLKAEIAKAKGRVAELEADKEKAEDRLAALKKILAD